MTVLDVAVVGGGFAGLSTAYNLTRRGLSVAVFERNDVPAEKTATRWARGCPVELGACYAAADYTALFKLAKEFGIESRRVGRVAEFSERSIAPQASHERGGTLGHILARGGSILRYCAGYASMMARFEAGDPAQVAALSQPLEQWLETAGLQPLQAIFCTVGDAFGYGPTPKVPALYLARFVTPGTVLAFASRRFWRFLTWGDFIQALAKKVDLRLSTPVQSAKFDDATGLWDLQCADLPVQARHVVVACAPQVNPVKDFFEPERRTILLEGADSTVYMMARVEVRDWFRGDRRTLIEKVGGCDMLGSARRDTPIEDNVGHYAVFAMISPDRRVPPEQLVADGIARDGGVLQHIHEIVVHPHYNTHFTPTAMKSGHYHRFRDLQGKNNLWVVNSLLAQENWRSLHALALQTSDAIVANTATARAA